MEAFWNDFLNLFLLLYSCMYLGFFSFKIPKNLDNPLFRFRRTTPGCRSLWRPWRARRSPSRWSPATPSRTSRPRSRTRRESHPTSRGLSSPESSWRMAVRSRTITSRKVKKKPKIWHKFGKTRVKSHLNFTTVQFPLKKIALFFFFFFFRVYSPPGPSPPRRRDRAHPPPAGPEIQRGQDDLSQVLRAPPPQGHQLQEEEVRTHLQHQAQEEAQVGGRGRYVIDGASVHSFR